MAMSFTYNDGQDKNGGSKGKIRTVIATWTSDADGDATGATEKIVGYLLKGVTVPSNGPTANYDITITDSDSANLLAGCADDLADRHTTNTETVHFLLDDGTAGIAAYPAVASEITVTIANAGNTKSGTLTLFYEA